MTNQEARAYVCKPGYWLINISELGEPANWVEVVQPPPESNRLFGYERAEFMAKQYKPARYGNR